MTNSINTNISAYYAQANITQASNQASSSVARLSSGNAIVQASDNVSALAIGASLGTQVSALKAAQTNASQGTSLLQVADGSLSQIQTILQQMQSIANQAESGSLTDTDRGFLNQQFQSLSHEIDTLAASTNFNGVQLINGGLGTTVTLANLDSLAANFNPTAVTGSTAGTAVTSVKAIQAFDNLGADQSIVTNAATPKTLDITDSSGTVLTNSAYNNVNTGLVGKFSGFSFSSVIYGGATGSGTVHAEINGLDFSGAYTGSTATTVLLNNGNTYVKLAIAAGDINFTDAGTVQTSSATLGQDFKDIQIERTSIVQGVDFAGTALAGAVGGTDNVGLAATRLSSTNANITNFQYAGNLGANANEISVQINGQTFLATGLQDNFGNTTTAATNPGLDLAFQSQDGQSLVIDLTGMTTPLGNIRTNADDQAALVNALNEGFSRAGSGLNFQLGTTATSTVNVNLSSASTNSLFAGQVLNVASAASATAASTVVGDALNTITAMRATVGAYESQFNFASAALQVGVQNQSAAQSQLLDTDIASESTSYATEQVKLQAGISVLAQANQQLQALLKLIG